MPPWIWNTTESKTVKSQRHSERRQDMRDEWQVKVRCKRKRQSSHHFAVSPEEQANFWHRLFSCSSALALPSYSRLVAFVSALAWAERRNWASMADIFWKGSTQNILLQQGHAVLNPFLSLVCLVRISDSSSQPWSSAEYFCKLSFKPT